MADVLGLQEEIARAILDEMRGTFGAEPSVRITRRAMGNATAYNLYLKGRHKVNQRSEASLRRAMEYFETAIAEDSRFALA